MHFGISALIGAGVRMAAIPAPLDLLYLFRPFGEMGLNTVSKIICLVLMGGAEFMIDKVIQTAEKQHLNPSTTVQRPKQLPKKIEL